MPNSKSIWKKPNPQAKRYAPIWSGPIACRIRRVVQSEKTTCSGTRSASQNVPLSKRPRTGGSARVPEMAVVEAELTGSFLDGGDGVDTPSSLRDGGGIILAARGMGSEGQKPRPTCMHAIYPRSIAARSGGRATRRRCPGRMPPVENHRRGLASAGRADSGRAETPRDLVRYPGEARPDARRGEPVALDWTPESHRRNHLRRF